MLAMHALEEGAIATLTIRDLDDEIRDKLRVRAAKRGVSMEAEVQAILADAVKDDPSTDSDSSESGAWYRRMRQRLAETNGYWEDDFVDFVNHLRKLPAGTTYEEFLRDRDRLLGESERES